MNDLSLEFETLSIDETMISQTTVILTLTYADCPTSTDSQTFVLDVLCTTATEISLTDGTGTTLTFNFIEDTSLTITYTYTHCYCEPHSVTFYD